MQSINEYCETLINAKRYEIMTEWSLFNKKDKKNTNDSKSKDQYNKVLNLYQYIKKWIQSPKEIENGIPSGYAYDFGIYDIYYIMRKYMGYTDDTFFALIKKINTTNIKSIVDGDYIEDFEEYINDKLIPIQNSSVNDITVWYSINRKTYINTYFDSAPTITEEKSLSNSVYYSESIIKKNFSDDIIKQVIENNK